MKKQMNGTVTLDLVTYNGLLKESEIMEKSVKVREGYQGEPKVEIFMNSIIDQIKEQFKSMQDEGLFQDYYINMKELPTTSELWTYMFKKKESEVK